MDEFCAVHLGPGGPSYTTSKAALVKFRDEQVKSLAGGFVLDPVAHRAALAKLRSARFFSARDGSAKSKDIIADGDAARRSRFLSPTRDMMRGPSWDRPIARELYTLDSNSVPGFGRWADAGVSADRFVNEVNALKMRGMIDALPDFESDESMAALFEKVHDLAQEEAVKQRVDLGNRNRVIDNAPGLYLFSELLKRTSILIEEDFTELWARRIFPIRNLNTWMPQWLFESIDDRGVLPSYVNIERLPSSAQRGSENRDGTLRNLAYCFHAASWTKLELMRYAEAVANGAPNIDIGKRRIDNAVRMMNFREDLTTFFGDIDVDILGLYSDASKTGVERIPSTDYGGPFGGAGPDVDRDLLIGAVKQIFIDTETVLAPDTIMLGKESWAHVNDRLYGSTDSDAGTNKTVLEMAMPSLEKFGIKDVLLVPEVGFSASQQARLEAHGLSAANAERYAGGDGDGDQSMVVCKRDATVMEMIVAKDRIMYPTQEVHNDRVETRMLQGDGGLAIYKPAGVKIVTDVGPN